MTTRLDRLFLLLDTGSTAVVRKSAAEQLGEVQKLHPHELNNLLTKVHGYLCSSTWETRIAAGHAVSAIASNVKQWDPQGVEEEGNACSPIQAAGCVPLSNFSIAKVLKHGVSLMGSEGKEYELDEDIVGLNQKEKLAWQKQQLNKRLGLDMPLGLEIKSEDFYQDEDLYYEKQEEGLISANKECIEGIVQQEMMSKLQQEKLLSARERNRAKRKAKQMGRQQSRDNGADCTMEPPLKRMCSNSSMTEQKDNDNTLNMEEIDEWPFDAFCELLEGELFSPSWERRHGAATGLRQVIRLHGRGAGRTSDTPRQQMDTLNQLWLEDLALRLICVLALDRFGDYVSDEVVAPVRETCAQALGVTLQHLSEAGVLQVVQVLLQLQGPPQWEVRHGGLLGLKYVLAVRHDLASGMIGAQLPAIMGGLHDASDDVRGVAAAALLTVTDSLVKDYTQQAHDIVASLWSALIDLDDLTASTNSIMALLAALLSQPGISTQTGLPLVELVPRLFPFLRHAIRSVRQASLCTLSTLVKGSDASSWLPAVLVDTLRLIYQRTLIEPSTQILGTVQEVWQDVLNACTDDELLMASTPYLGTWLCLMMQSANLPFDLTHFLEVKHQERGGGGVTDLSPQRLRMLQQQAEEAEARRLYIGGATALSGSPTERDAAVVTARHAAAGCIGALCQRLCQARPLPCVDTPTEALTKLLIFHLDSKAAMQKIAVANVVTEWTRHQKTVGVAPELLARLHACLTETIFYDEVAQSFTRMQHECKHFIASLKEQKLTLPDEYNANVLTLELCQKLCTEVYESLRCQLKSRQHATFDCRQSSLKSTVTTTATDQQSFHLRVQRSLAGCIIALSSFPAQMNPLVRPLMDTVKKESNQQLQEIGASNIASLIELCIGRTPCPTPKIIKNLCAQLCTDKAFAPEAVMEKTVIENQHEAELNTCKGILTLNAQQKTPAVARGRRPATLKKVPTTVPCVIDMNDIQQENDEEKRAALITRRGSSLALCQIARAQGAALLKTVPQLWNAMLSDLQQLRLTEESGYDAEAAQNLVNSLCVLEVVGSSLHESLHPQLTAVLPQLVLCLEHPYTVVRHCAARVFGMLSRVVMVAAVHCLVERVIPLLGSADNVTRRQGAIEATTTVIEQLQLDVMPYLVLLVVPVLGRMSDQDTAVRLMASTCFGYLIRIMPLESGIPDPPSLPPALLQQKERHRRFLEQLVDPRCIPQYDVPVPVRAELRSYQQDGVNWLAFLNTYQLHGVLCDDMGLGKTLQSICILAGDHHTRSVKYKETKRADCVPLPSLVVCPPTLTGHWVDEIAKFVSPEVLNPLHYTGVPLERTRLQKKFADHNLVIASYDVVRNDIGFFGKQNWNYCILDEGHIIKNHKTKLSKAVKQVVCNHRLILSGTPIQNNVLELWSLFDFLMPGFLGTERQFSSRYGRPILLSRDPRSSQADQEAGALAMEALHRQVLPFLLRRMKKDVLKDLPPKIIQDYYCDPSPLQVQLYEDFAKTQTNLVEGSVSETDSNKVPNHIFQALTYLRKVCNHPALVLTPAHPQYAPITAQLKQQKTNMRSIQHASKLTALRQLLLDCGIGVGADNGDNPVVGQHRVLLFCQLKAMLDIVENDLFKAEMPDVTFLRLDGSVPPGHRHAIVNRFNNDPSIDVLLLTTHVGGLGLNLTGADTVVFVEHDWNPSKDLQAMDRAHRIGQKKVVNVYRLITRGTLEEKIMGLQKFKMNIANTIISQENSSLVSMGTNQLLDLFSLGPEKSTSGQSDNTFEELRKTAGQQNGMAAMLENMGELWDDQQYESEYNLDNFMQTLRDK